MCAGALIQARVRRLVFGTRDERAGAVESRFRICDTDFLNHRIEISSGVLEDECRELIQQFFRARRAEGRMKDEDTLINSTCQVVSEKKGVNVVESGIASL